MAKTKADLLKQAREMGVDVTEKNTVAEISAAIAKNSEAPVPASEATLETEEATTTAKAGKRSAKGQAEAEERQAKVEAQQHRGEEAAEDEKPKPKQPVKPTRTRLERRGKKYRDLAAKIEKGKAYSLGEATKLALDTNPAKFDASVELHVRLNVDPRQADQNIRAQVILPEGTGKEVRVAVFADDKVANADLSGVDTITKQLEKGEINFDVLVSTPANMPKLGKYARLLGPRGLMPNPKSGTVTNDLNKAVNEAKAGRVEYRVDSTGIVHLAVGKVSFGADRIGQNLDAVMASINSNKPSSLKGIYINSAYITTSMGPSVALDTKSL